MTSTDLATASPVTLSPVRPDAALILAELKAKADEHADNSRKASTWRVYETDWKLYVEWCGKHARTVFPSPDDATSEGATPAQYVSETIRLYLTALAEPNGDRPGLAASTLTKKLSSISVGYAHAGVTAHRQIVWAEQVVSVLTGIRKAQADAGRRKRKKKAMRTKDLRRILATFASDPLDVRDRALLLVLFSGAFRRSEVAALDITDFTVVEDGLEVVLGRSKTDQTGEGKTKGLPYGSHMATCPVRSWLAWLKVYGVTEGPAFPSMDQWGNLKALGGQPRRLDGRDVAEVVKRRAAAAGLAGDWGGHSGRRGFATEAYAQEVSEMDIMQQGGWKSPNVMRGYREEAGVWKHNAATKLGL
jgi:integrase